MCDIGLSEKRAKPTIKSFKSFIYLFSCFFFVFFFHLFEEAEEIYKCEEKQKEAVE
jgi:hypothetical protein